MDISWQIWIAIDTFMRFVPWFGQEASLVVPRGPCRSAMFCADLDRRSSGVDSRMIIRTIKLIEQSLLRFAIVMAVRGLRYSKEVCTWEGL